MAGESNLQIYEPNIEACSWLIMLHILFYYFIQSKVHKKGSFKSQKSKDWSAKTWTFHTDTIQWSKIVQQKFNMNFNWIVWLFVVYFPFDPFVWSYLYWSLKFVHQLFPTVEEEQQQELVRYCRPHHVLQVYVPSTINSFYMCNKCIGQTIDSQGCNKKCRRDISYIQRHSSQLQGLWSIAQTKVKHTESPSYRK